jgi:arylsulfatase A-like enzyme
MNCEANDKERTLSKPNVVFFMLDQLSEKWLAAAAAGIFPTPNIDALRARSLILQLHHE